MIELGDSFDGSALRGMPVLVTGASGFVGRRLCAALIAQGAQVTRLSRADTVAVDIEDASAVQEAVRAHAPRLVFHLAARPDWRQDPTQTAGMLRLHTVGTAHVLEAARLAGVERVVLFGSAGEYGAAVSPMHEGLRPQPLDPYSVSKLAASELALMYARSFGLACTVVRPFVVYGPGEPEQRLLPSVFARAAAGGGEAAFTAGEQVRDFVYVDDVVEAALRLALASAAAGEIVNVGTGEGCSVRALVEHACAVSGARVRPQFGALPYRVGEPIDLRADVGKLRRMLGWVPPVDVATGVARAWAAFGAR